METKVEFPAYNIYYRQRGTWMLHYEPVFGKTLKDVEFIATGILFWNDDTDAVRIYGIFNCQQTFIREINMSNLHTNGSDEDRMKKAIRSAIEICSRNENTCGYVGKGCVCNALMTIKNFLSSVIESCKRDNDK